MKNIEIRVSPYRSGRQMTRLTIDGVDVVSNESRLTAFVVRKNVYEWLYPYSRGFQKWQGILPEFVRELNDDTFDITYHGRERDYQFFRDGMAAQQESLTRRGMETDVSQRFVPLSTPTGMVNNVKNLLQDFIDTIVQRLDGDGYEELINLREKISAFPVALDDLHGLAEEFPGMLAERGAVLCGEGIRVIAVDGSKAIRDLQEDLAEPLKKAQDDEDPFVLICLLGEASEQNQRKCIQALEQMDIKLRSSAVCMVASDASQCADAFSDYLDEIYLPFMVSGVIDGMAQTAEQLKNRYEDAYIFQIYNDVRDLQDSLA